MKKVILFLLVSAVSLPTFSGTGQEKTNFFNIIQNKAKLATQHAFSKQGLKDIAASYALCIGITLLHEFGHAIAAKMIYNNPINITLGSNSLFANSLVKIGGIKLASFNPFKGITHIPGSLPYNSTSDLIVTVSGPISGLISSSLSYYLVKNHTDKFPIAHAISLFCLFQHTLGPVTNDIFIPGTDAYYIKKLLTKKI